MTSPSLPRVISPLKNVPNLLRGPARPHNCLRHPNFTSHGLKAQGTFTQYTLHHSAYPLTSTTNTNISQIATDSTQRSQFAATLGLIAPPYGPTFGYHNYHLVPVRFVIFSLSSVIAGLTTKLGFSFDFLGFPLFCWLHPRYS